MNFSTRFLTHTIILAFLWLVPNQFARASTVEEVPFIRQISVLLNQDKEGVDFDIDATTGSATAMSFDTANGRVRISAIKQLNNSWLAANVDGIQITIEKNGSAHAVQLWDFDGDEHNPRVTCGQNLEKESVYAMDLPSLGSYNEEQGQIFRVAHKWRTSVPNVERRVAMHYLVDFGGIPGLIVTRYRQDSAYRILWYDHPEALVFENVRLNFHAANDATVDFFAPGRDLVAETTAALNQMGNN